MDDTIYVIGHKSPDTDSICSAIAYAHFKQKLGMKNVKAARLGEPNLETKFVLDYFKVDLPEILEDGSGKKLILLDHNEVSQTIEKIDEGEILEIIDHHKIGDIQTPNPIFFHAEPIGSTATIIADFYFDEGIDLEKDIAGILLASILSDTVIFKSPTCTQKDKDIAKKLASMVGIEIEKFGIDMFKAKADLASKSAREILVTDFKEFDFSGNRVGIGQIEVMDEEEVQMKRKEILEEMENLRNEKGLVMVTLMITNILKEGSELLFVGDKKEIFERAFNAKVENDSIYLEGVMSRKKQVVPPLENAFAHA
ncbi:MAG: putative manganese-dependent inorganic diphosphatase [Candidatus Hydrothermarchaeota archaeon]